MYECVMGLREGLSGTGCILADEMYEKKRQCNSMKTDAPLLLGVWEKRCKALR
jgi:hypothetical protein